MELNSNKAWQNNLKLENYKSKVDYSLRKPKKTNIDEFKDSLFKTLKKSPSKDLNITKDSKSSLASAPNYFSHYSSLRNFRTSSGLADFKSSASSFNSPIQRNNIFDAGSLYANSSKGSSPSSRLSGSSAQRIINYQKPLQDVLTIGTLSKATGLVVNNGLDKVSFSYLRQLKQFCGLVMQSLDN